MSAITDFPSVTESATHVVEAHREVIGGVVLFKCIGDMMRVIFAVHNRFEI